MIDSPPLFTVATIDRFWPPSGETSPYLYGSDSTVTIDWRLSTRLRTGLELSQMKAPSNSPILQLELLQVMVSVVVVGYLQEVCIGEVKLSIANILHITFSHKWTIVIQEIVFVTEILF